MKDSKSKNQMGSQAIANQATQKKGKGASLPSANVAQLQAPEEELQMKAIVQKVEPEEELQMKPIVQMAEEEEELKQAKFETIQKVEEEEEVKQGKFEAVQMVEEEDELKQAKFETVQKKDEAPATNNNTGMPNNLKSGIENLSGMDMGDVRVNYNSEKPKEMGAHAYAQGNDIQIGPGQEKHLGHEAWHVVQQRQGRVQATKQMKGGVAVNDDPGLEHEADVMGEKALRS